MDQWIQTIIPHLTTEDLPESYRQVAAIIGVEAAVRLSEYLGGLPFYFPQLDGILRKKRDQAIKKEFTGTNYRDLAIKYSLTERWVREILSTNPSQEQPPLF
ncbi:MAG: hypothetical protein LBQ00_06740 [Syntrophobacterales bacterium]|jgi:Mor family transcriptional regulator|nr:hypothetical protein [Syntrophobacterales bacterium]